MREIIRKYQEENFSTDYASLDFSLGKLERNILKNEVIQGSFQLLSGGEEENKGFIYSSSNRFRILTPKLLGNCFEVNYEFDGNGLEEGESVKGYVNVVSAKGEAYLPFVITVYREAFHTSIGDIKNLFHFANLAKSNWKEAVQLFYSKGFVSVFNGSDRQYFTAYKGLVKEFGNERNVEEFLIRISKKREIEYLLDKEEITLKDPEGVVQETIEITKNGWGFVALHVFVEGNFLTVEKESFLEEDFLGNHCSLNLYLYSEKLHFGNNYALVRLIHSYGELCIPVTVKKTREKTMGTLQKRVLTLELMNCYLNFRTRKENVASWVQKTEEIIHKLIRLDSKSPAYRLFQAQILITQERYNEAKWVLDHVQDMLEEQEYSPEVICYFLYLQTLYKPEEEFVDKRTEEIEGIYKQNRGNWRIAWLLLYLREEYSKKPGKKWLFIEEQFKYGNASPVLFVEAVYVLNQSPTVLQELGEFQIEVLNFARKYKLLQEDTVAQITYLVGRNKQYSKRLLHILEYCYEVTRDLEIVQQICELLMKGHKTDREAFRWYALGVEKQLRITRLYEYYMLSVDLESKREIPKIVLLYFAYSCSLPYERAAFLYAGICRNKKRAPELFESYQEQMQQFVVDQLQLGHMNQDLAVLYEEIISPKGMCETVAKPLAPLLFQHEVQVEDVNICQVVVIHDKMKGEVRYPVVNGKAVISLFSEEYHIFLQDGFGNRYGGFQNYTLKKYISPRRMVHAMQSYELQFLGMELYLCESSGDYVAITQEKEKHYASLLKSEQIREEYKREIRCRLAAFYFENDMVRKLDEFLSIQEPEGLLQRERVELIQYMISRGMYEKAFLWMKTYGSEGISGKHIFRMCSRLLLRNDFEYEESLLTLCYIAFTQNKYDESVLKYLMDYYRGTTRELRNIWKAAVNFDMDVQELCERILIQLLYTGVYIPEGVEIFISYMKQGGSLDVKQAYMTYCAYEFFIEDKVMNTDIFRYFTQMIQKGTITGKLCKLAYLKYFAENSGRIDAETSFTMKGILEELTEEQIFLPFFKEFTAIYPKLSVMQDRKVLEYRTNNKCKVCLHYVFARDGETTHTEYRKEELYGLYGRLYVKNFVLFFGESIQYYITEESNGNEKLTESGTLSLTDMTRENSESKYALINDIAIARNLQDYDTVEQLMEELYKKEFLIGKLFPIR